MGNVRVVKVVSGSGMKGWLCVMGGGGLSWAGEVWVWMFEVHDGLVPARLSLEVLHARSPRGYSTRMWPRIHTARKMFACLEVCLRGPAPA